MCPRYKASGIFSIPSKLGNLTFPKAMLELGASVSVLPLSIFEKLKLGYLQKTGTIFQLAYHSTAHPKCVLEDVFVQVNKLIFADDFYILDMDDVDEFNKNSIIFRGYS